MNWKSGPKNVKKILKLTNSVFSEWYFTAVSEWFCYYNYFDWFWTCIWMKNEVNEWNHACICLTSFVLFCKRTTYFSTQLWRNNWAVLKNLLNLRVCSQLEQGLCRYLQIRYKIKANLVNPSTYRLKWGRDKRVLPREKIWILAILNLKCRWKMVDKKKAW